MTRWVACLDVGGTSIKAGAVARGGVVTAVQHRRIDHRAPKAVLIADLVDTVTGVAAAVDQPVGSVAIAFPAPFDYPAGRPLLTHKFASLLGCALGDELRALLARVAHADDLRIVFGNDAVAAALGEAEWGAGDRSRRTLMVTLGTGLGACLVEHGREITGGAATDDAIPDLYRRHTALGLADDVFSARGLAARLGTTLDDVAHAVDAALPADPNDATAVHLAEFGEDLGTFLRPTIDAVDAELVVIGGGASAAFDRFVGPLTESLGVEVRQATLGSRAALLGAFEFMR